MIVVTVNYEVEWHNQRVGWYTFGTYTTYKEANTIKNRLKKQHGKARVVEVTLYRNVVST